MSANSSEFMATRMQCVAALSENSSFNTCEDKTSPSVNVPFETNSSVFDVSESLRWRVNCQGSRSITKSSRVPTAEYQPRCDSFIIDDHGHGIAPDPCITLLLQNEKSSQAEAWELCKKNRQYLLSRFWHYHRPGVLNF